MERPTLTIAVDTYLKPLPEPAASFEVDEIAKVLKGTVIPILAYRQEHGHICFTVDATGFNLATLHPSRKNTWWVYGQHCLDPQGHGADNDPKDSPSNTTKGYGIVLPGFNGNYYSTDPIGLKSQSFTWGEALHVDSAGSYRQPANPDVVYKIIKIAEVMQNVKGLFGGAPIKVNSWYRDPVTNRRVGGASQSRHMVGDAVDFHIPGVSLVNVYNRLDPWWASRGGLARGQGFVHIDGRGYRARWTYPGVN
jgi:hypothetical protein